MSTPSEPPPTTIALPGVLRMSFPDTATLRPCPISIPVPLVASIIFERNLASLTCTEFGLWPVCIAALGSAATGYVPIPERVLLATVIRSTRPSAAPPMSMPPGHVFAISLRFSVISASTLRHADTSTT